MSLDPLTNLPEKDPPKSTTTFQVNQQPQSDPWDLSHARKEANQRSSFVAAGDYGDYAAGLSPYYNPQEKADALSNNQSNWQAAGNTAMRLMAIVPGIIKNVGYIEDVATGTPNGNDITDAMEQWTEGINSAFPLYSHSNNAIVNWNNISGLVNSVGEFAVTGMGIGSVLSKTLGAVGKAGSAVNNVMRAAAQVGTATALTGIEGAIEGNQLLKSEYTGTYNKLFVEEINKGKTPEEAKIIADYKAKAYVQDAATQTMMTNYFNVALNLTSAGYFVRGGHLSKVGRQLDEITKKNTFKSLGLESLQEAAEEGVNVFAGAAGRTKLQQDLAGKDTKGSAAGFAAKNFSEIWDNVDKDELLSSMVLGAMGGFGNTAVSIGIGNLNTKWYKGKYVELREKYAEQKDFLDKVKKYYDNPKDASEVFLNITQSVAKMQQAQEARNAGNIELAETIEKDILADQMYNAIKTGTWNDFKDLFNQFTTNEQLTTEQKEKAKEASKLLNQYERAYNNVNLFAKKDNPNMYSLYINRVQDIHLKDHLGKLRSQQQELQSNLSIFKSYDTQGDLEKEEKRGKDTVATEKKLREISKEIVETQKQVVDNAEKFATILDEKFDELGMVGKVKQFANTIINNTKDKVGKAETIAELTNVLSRFTSEEEKQVALEKAAKKQNEDALPANENTFDSPESIRKFLVDRYNKRAALGYLETKQLEKITGQKFVDEFGVILPDVADWLHANMTQEIKDFFDAKAQAAKEEIERELTELENEGVESVTIENPNDVLTFVETPGSKGFDNSEIPVIHGPDAGDKYDDRFRDGLEILSNDPDTLVNKDIYFEIEPKKFSYGFNDDGSIKDKNSFVVLIVYYKDGNQNNKDKSNRVYLGKLRANTWKKGNTQMELSEGFRRVRSAFEKLNTTQEEILTIPYKSKIERILPGKISVVSEQRNPFTLLKPGEKLILGVAVNKGGVVSLDFGGDGKGPRSSEIRLTNPDKLRSGSVFMMIKGPDNLYYPIQLFVNKVSTLPSVARQVALDRAGKIYDQLIEKDAKGNLVNENKKKALIAELKRIAFVNITVSKGAVVIRSKNDKIIKDITREELIQLVDNSMAQVDVKSINVGDYNNLLASTGVIQSNMSHQRFMANNIVMSVPAIEATTTTRVKPEPEEQYDPFSEEAFNETFGDAFTENSNPDSSEDSLSMDEAAEELLFGGQPTVEINIQSDIESKKANIERRRQEELDEYAYDIVEKVEDYEFINEDGEITYVQVRTYKDGSRRAYQSIEKNKYGNALDNQPFKIVKEQSTEDYLKGYEDWAGTKTKTGERTAEEANLNGRTNKINAKYDAELSTLEQLETQSESTSEKEKINKEVISELYTSSLLKNNLDKLFVFGDNNERKGKGGQAIIRDEPNAIGISTKLKPSNTNDSFMSDQQLDENKKVINSDIEKIKQKAKKENKTIVLPKGGLGTGLAALATKAPETFNYLNKRLKEEFGFDNITGEIVDSSNNDIDLMDGLNDFDPSNHTPKPNTKYRGKEWNKQQELNKVEQMLPKDVAVEVYNDLLTIGDNIAYGYYQQAVVYLYEQASAGTGYHEAIHAIVDLVLSDEQKSKLFKEVEQKHFKNGIPETEFLYYSKIYPNLSKESLKEIILEEYLADGFIDYMQDHKSTKPGFIKNLFNKIKMWYHSVFKPGMNLNSFYKNVESGMYRSARIKMNKGFANPMFSIKTMDPVEKRKRINNLKVLYGDLMEELRSLDGNKNKSDAAILRDLGSKKKNGAEVMLSMIATRIIQDYLATQSNSNLSDNDKQYYKNKYTYFLKNFITAADFSKRIPSKVRLNFLGNTEQLVDVTIDIQSPLLREFLFSLEVYGVKVDLVKKQLTVDGEKEHKPENPLDATEELTEDDVGSQALELWQTRVNEVRSDESFSAELKRFLSTIRREEKDELGYDVTEDYEEVRNFLFENISNIYSTEEMMQKFETELRFMRPFANYIYQHLRMNQSLRSDMYTYIASKSDDDYLQVNTQESGNVHIFNSNRTQIKNVIIEDLKNEFVKSKMLNKDEKILSHEAKVFGEQFDYLYTLLVKNNDAYDEITTENLIYLVPKANVIKDLADLFKRYNIDITEAQLKAIGNRGRGHFVEFLKDAVYPVATMLKKKKNLFNLLEEEINENSALERLAGYLVPVTVHKSEKSMNTVDNKTIFTHSYSNFAKSLISKMKNPAHFQRILQSYKSTPFYKTMPLFSILENNEYSLSEMGIPILDGVKREDREGRRFEKMSPQDLEWLNFHAFYNQNRNFAFYRLPALSDAPQTAFLKFKKFKGAVMDEKFWNYVYDVVLQEYNRNVYLEQNPELIDEIDNLKSTLKSNPYVLSPFMSKLGKGFNAALPENKQAVIDAAKEYYKTEFEKELVRLENIGLITKQNGKYIIASDETSGQPMLDIGIQRDESLVETLTDYFYNSVFVNTQMISLFSGDPIFYKSNDDWQKRNKQIWSPVLLLDTSRINEYYGTVTVADMKVNSSNDFINNYLSEIFKNHPMRDVIVDNFKDGTSATDAQSFITLNRYKEIMEGMNRWNEDHEEMFQRIKSGKTIADTEVIAFYDEYWSIFGPIKPFDFHHLDSMNINGKEYMLNNPYQVKRAEVPIIPQLLGDDSIIKQAMQKLEKIEEETGLNFALNFDSGVKVGGHNKYVSLKKFLEDESEASKIKTVKLRNDRYGYQVEVPEHYIDTDNNLGTQFMKLIMADTPSNAAFNADILPNINNLFSEEQIKDGVKFSDVVMLYQDLLGQNLEQGLTQLKGQTENIISIKKMLWRNGLDNNLPSSYFESIGNPNTADDFTLPLWFMGWGKKNEQILSSMIKNYVVKQKLPGASLVNQSSVGKEDLKIVYDKETGAIKYYEARLPYWMNKMFEGFVDPKTGEIDIKEFELFIKAKGENPDDYLMAVFYRIPTEHKHSMFPIRIVGFTHPFNGGVIELPHEATKISGFDFDVDKLYGLLPSFDYIKKDGKVVDITRVKYDPNTLSRKTNESGNKVIQSKSKQRANAILDISLGILRHPNSAPQMMEPSSFDDLKETAYRAYFASKGEVEVLDQNENGEYVVTFADLRKKLKEEKLDLALPSTQSEYIKRNITGKALIGFFANHNTAHAYFQQTNIDVNAVEDGYFPSFDKEVKVSLSGMYNVDGRLISKILAAFLAASTDNAKDPIASFMNLNLSTANTYAYLIRLGFNPETITFFMVQQGANENYKEFYESIAGEEANKVSQDPIKNFDKEQLIYLLKKGAEAKAEYAAIVEKNLPTKEYAEEIQKHFAKHVVYYKKQYHIYNTFNTYTKQGASLGNISKAIKLDNTSNRSTLSDNMVFRHLYDFNTQYNKMFSNLESLRNIPLLRAFKHFGLDKSIEIYERYFPWNNAGFEYMRDIMENIKGKNLTAQEMESINYNILTYLASGFEFFNKVHRTEGKYDANNKLVPEKDPSVIMNLEARLTSYLKNNPNSEYKSFLQRFVVRKRNLMSLGMLESGVRDKVKFNTIEFYRSGLSNIEKQKITDLWDSMLNSNDPTEKQLALDLARYSFFKSGFAVGATSFVDYIPTSFYTQLKDSNGLSFKDYMINAMEEFNNNYINHTDAFIRQYSRNIYTRRGAEFKLFKYVIADELIDKPIERTTIINGRSISYVPVIRIQNKHMNKYQDFDSVKAGRTEGISQYVIYKHKGNDFLYTFLGFDRNGSMVYRKTRPLGLKNYYMEYDLGNENLVPSISRLSYKNWLPIDFQDIIGTEPIMSLATYFDYEENQVTQDSQPDEDIEGTITTMEEVDDFMKNEMNKSVVNNSKYEWSRFASNNYEVSSAGDKRFSAFYAQLKDGRYIEDIYQLDIKGNGIAITKPITNKQNPTKSSIQKTGAFKREVSREQSWNEYKNLWKQYLNENPELFNELKEKAKGKVLTDKFAVTDVSQARALAEILNENIQKPIEQPSEEDYEESSDGISMDDDSADFFMGKKEETKEEILEWFNNNFEKFNEETIQQLKDSLGISSSQELFKLPLTEENMGKLINIKCIAKLR